MRNLWRALISDMSPNTRFQARTVTALVEDQPGVLARIASLCRRRGLNIASLAVGRSEKPGFSRMTFVLEGPPSVVDHCAAQFDRLVNVVEAVDITERNHIWRELALIKVKTTPATRVELLELARVYRANIIDIGVNSLTFELTGGREKIDSMIELLTLFGIREVMRTGRVAVLRGTLFENEDDGEFQAGRTWSAGIQHEYQPTPGVSGSV